MKWTAARILRKKRQLLAHPQIGGQVGRTLTGKSYDEFVRELCRRLPGKPDFAVVHASVQDLLAVPLTEQLLDATLWRLLGNLPRVLAYESVLPWAGQRQDEWVPVQVLRVSHGLSPKGKPGVRLLLQSLAGSCCPARLHGFWTRRQCFLHSRSLGFPPAYRPRGMHNVMELMSMRFFAHVRVALSQERPCFDEIAVDAAFQGWNRRLMRLRTRPPGVFACPEGFPPTVPCYRCYAGVDICPVATHETTYVQRYCPSCHSDEAWHDPSQRGDGDCLSCQKKKLYRASKE